MNFPVRAQGLKNDIIVEFITIDRGIVISSNDHRYGVGYYADDWADVTNENVWKIINHLLENPTTKYLHVNEGSMQDTLNKCEELEQKGYKIRTILEKSIIMERIKQL